MTTPAKKPFDAETAKAFEKIIQPISYQAAMACRQYDLIPRQDVDALIEAVKNLYGQQDGLRNLEIAYDEFIEKHGGRDDQ